MAVLSLEQLQKFAQDNGPLIGVITTVGGILIVLLFKWPAKAMAWWKRRKEKKPPGGAALPTETIRAVLEQAGSYQGPEWNHATRLTDQAKCMSAHARWTLTNITRAPVKLVDTYLDFRPPVHGMILVRNPHGIDFGDYYLLPGMAVPGSTDFSIFPPIRKPGQDLKTTVVLVDNLGNTHRVRVAFRGPKA